MTIKELRKQVGATQQEFADYFSISVRNIQEWEQGRKHQPPYLIGLLIRILEHDGIHIEKQQHDHKNSGTGS